MTVRGILTGAGATASTTLVNSTKQQNTATSGNLVLSVPSGTVSGNLILAVAVSGSTQTSTWTAPAGWTKELDLGTAALFSRVATGSESSTYTFTSSRTNALLQGYMLTFNNAVFGAVSSGWSKSGNNNQVQTDAFTTGFTNAKQYVMSVLAHVGASQTISTPSGYTDIDSDSDGNAPSSKLLRSIVRGTNEIPAVSATSTTSSTATAVGFSVVLVPIGTAVFSSYDGGTQNIGISAEVTSPSFTITSGSGTMTAGADTTFSVNGGSYVTSASVSAGNSITVRGTSSSSWDTTSTFTVSLSGTVYSFRSFTFTGAQVFTSNGTFVVPAGATTISVVCIGGGGGGGGTSSNTSLSTAAGGGGAGALSYTNNISTTPGESLTVVVGLGGNGGLSHSNTSDPSSTGTLSPTDGGSGGVSSVSRGGTTLISSNGGTGGPRTTTAGPSSGGDGGTTGGVGSVKYSGGRGGNSAINYGSTGGWGGSAATLAGNGQAGYTGDEARDLGFAFAKVGEGGSGTTLSSSGWSINPGPVPLASYPGGTSAATDGLTAGGAGGGGIRSSTNYYNGRPGARGAVAIVWGGRTFSSNTTY
jgi:hypothetical protein